MSTIKGCVLSEPTRQSVQLGDKHLNLSAIHRATGIDLSYLSHIFAGRKECTVSTYKKIASVVGMGLEELLEAIDVRKQLIEIQREKVITEYNTRVKSEDAEDRKMARSGKPVLPRLSALRLKDTA